MEKEVPEIKNSMEIKMKRLQGRLKRNAFKNRCFQGKRSASDQFINDETISKMREPFTEEFYDTYKKGFDYFIKGRWEDAKDVFE